MAIDSFPALLAPHDRNWPFAVLTLFHHPLRQQLQSVVQEDDALKRLFTEDDQDLGRRGHYYSSFRGGDLQDVMFGEMIIGSAWDTATKTTEGPGLNELVEQVHENVDVLRQAAAGGSSSVTALVVFTGFKTGNGESIATPWGMLRPLHDWERRLAPASLEGAASGTQADGREVTVSYAGEMVLETEVPYAIVVDESREWDALAPWPVATDALQRRFEGLQLAALLASDGPPGRWVTAKLAWTWVGDPLAHGSHVGWSDTRSAPFFMPVELSSDECKSVEAWAQLVTNRWTPSIDIAVRRLLSAANARTDMADRLVDSVIVWENLFGTSQGEPRLRISAALAWLLSEEPGPREELQRQLKNLYDYRSKIVHGGHADEESLGLHANSALTYARDGLRALLRDRSDVLALPDGAARSLRLIMGG